MLSGYQWFLLEFTIGWPVKDDLSLHFIHTFFIDPSLGIQYFSVINRTFWCFFSSFCAGNLFKKGAQLIWQQKNHSVPSIKAWICGIGSLHCLGTGDICKEAIFWFLNIFVCSKCANFKCRLELCNFNKRVRNYIVRMRKISSRLQLVLWQLDKP